MEHNWTQWGHNREKFGALLKSIIGNFKSIIGSGLVYTLYVVYTVYPVYSVYAVYIVYPVYVVYTVYAVYTVSSSL